MKSFHIINIVAGGLCAIALNALAADETAVARQILADSGIKGGLVAHVGGGDGRLTAALRAGDSFLVQGLEKDAAKVEAARRHLLDQGLYGKVTVRSWPGGRLPYTDNLVNLLVADATVEVAEEEILRVLAPEGVACLRRDGQWKKLVKPRPPGMDEWSHYLYNPENNAVSHDTLVQPPRHLQWVAGPNWGRHHDHMSSSSAMVSASGRNFYIFDEGPRSSILLPSDWKVIARDAFSGVLLWKRQIGAWHNQLWRLKSGPAQLPRRIVATRDQVFVTLAIDGPVTVLDAATGKTVRTCEGTAGTEEILHRDGVLYLMINEKPLKISGVPATADYEFKKSPRRIMAVRADSGQVLWNKKFNWVVPLTLTVDAGRVLLFDGERVNALNKEDGQEHWTSALLGQRPSVPSYYGANVVSYGDVILFAGVDPGQDDYHKDNARTLFAFEAATGKTLWKAEHPSSGYRSPEDVLVVNNLVWSAPLFNSADSGIFTGRDLHTGEVKVEFPPDVKTHWFHHRCYRARATDNYILTSRTGIEFVDVRAQHWECHHWVRGACLLGIMPANGMINNAPHPCACYLEAKLFGFNALSGALRTQAVGPDDSRLEPGPAYAEVSARPERAANPTDWPTYRGNAERSGFTRAAIPTRLQPA